MAKRNRNQRNDFFFHIDIVLGSSKKKHHSFLNFDRSCIKFLFPRLVDANFTASRKNEPSTFEALFMSFWLILVTIAVITFVAYNTCNASSFRAWNSHHIFVCVHYCFSSISRARNDSMISNISKSYFVTTTPFS